MQNAAGTFLAAAAGREGLAIPLDAFRARLGGEAALRKILGALTVTEKVHPGRPRGMGAAVRKAWTVDRARDLLFVPRVKAAPFLRARAGGPLLDAVVAAPDALPPPVLIPAARAATSFLLYDYQEAAVAHLLAGPLAPAAVAAQTAVAYLQMDTGLGKSIVGGATIVRRGEAGLVVVPTAAIAEQWVDDVRMVYPAIRIAVYHNPPKGSKKVAPTPQTHDIVVIIINTFREKGPDFMEGFGTVVFDEAHEYHSPSNGKALWLAQTRAVLGLSATPEERPDGLDKYICLHLGPVIYPRDIPGCDVESVNFRGVVRSVEYSGEPSCCETVTTAAGMMSAILTIGNIIRDAARLRLIAAEVARLNSLHETPEAASLGLGPRPPEAATPKHPAGEIRRHGVFVFAEHREYLPQIRDALLEWLRPEDIIAPELDDKSASTLIDDVPAAPTQAALVPTQAVSILRGGAAKNAMSNARSAGAHVVLTTYGFSRRGVSLPDMTAIVLSTSRRNGMRQILGRILRRGSDESIIRQVVDIVDVCTGLKGQGADRRKIYREKNYPITKVQASHADFAERGRPAIIGGAEDDGADEPPDLSGLTIDDLFDLVAAPAE